MVAHVLSKRYDLFTHLTTKILGFEPITELYTDDQDFRTIYAFCLAKKAMNDYYVFPKFLIKKSMLCIRKCSIKDLFLRGAYSVALMGHLRINKVYKMLHKYFFWPKTKHDVYKFCSKGLKRKETKSRSQLNGFYTLLNIPNKSIKFVLGLLHTKKSKDCIFVVEDIFIKMSRNG